MVPALRFDEAAAELLILCDRIDASEEIDDCLIEEFTDRKTDVALAVDYQKALYAKVVAEIGVYKTYRDSVTTKIKQLCNLRDRIVATTKAVVEANPTVTFRDSLGRKLSVLPNPTPKVVLAPEALAGNQFSEYTRTITKYEPDVEKIKETLLSGTELSWAKLEYGTQLRGLKTPTKGLTSV